MTYADVEMGLAYFWGLYAIVLVIGLCWAGYVLIIDEPRRLRRLARAAER